MAYINSHTSNAGTFSNGDNIDISFNFTQNIFANTGSDISGNPNVALSIGTKTRYAEYNSGSGSSNLLFRYTVKADDLDRDGVTIRDRYAIDLSGGTLLNAWNAAPNLDLQTAGLILSNNVVGALLTNLDTLLGGMNNISAAGGQTITDLTTTSSNGSGAILTIITSPAELEVSTVMNNISTNLGGATNNTYTGISHSGGTGSGATFDVVVASGTASSVTSNAVGSGYKVGDILTIDKDSVGGGSGNLQITLTSDDIVTIDNAVSSVRVTTAGSLYRVGDILTVLASDISGATSNLTFRLDSRDINGVIVEGSPIFSTNATTNATEDIAYSYTVTAYDYDSSSSVDLSGTTIPSWLSFNSLTNKLTGTPTNSEVGVHDVVITATDISGNTNTQEFTITVANVNDAPDFTSTAITSATEDALYYYKVSAIDVDPTNDTFSFTGTTIPSWLNFTASTGVLTGTPLNEHVGNHNVVLTVTDISGASNTQSFTINVAQSFDAPVFTSTPSTTATEEVVYSYTITTSDIDVGDTVTLTATNKPSFLTLNAATGVLSGTPQNEDSQNYFNVLITATDSGGVSATQSYRLQVIGTNDPPVITSTPITSATEDVLYSYQLTFTDEDPDDFATLYTCSCSVLPDWLNFNRDTGLLSGTPINKDVGNHNIKLKVEDSDCAVVSQNFTITVANVNDPPTFTSTPVTSVLEDSLYTYTIITTDIDPTGDTVSLTGTTIPTWLTLNVTTNILSGTPTNSEVGTHNVVIIATDSNNASTTQSFTITVTNTNDPPIFTSTAITSATEDTLYSYTVTSSDIDVGDSIILSATTLPSWLNLNANTGILSGTPLVGDVGVGLSVNDVVLKVTDAAGTFANQSFTIDVANFNDFPVFTSTPITSATEDSVYTYTPTATDEEGDAITFTTPSIPSWLSFHEGVLTGTPLNSNVGSHNITITATSSGVNSTNQTFAITVANTNDAPTITSTAIITVNEDSLYSYTIITSDVDAGDTVTLTGTSIPSWLSFNTSTGILSGTPTNSEVGKHSVTITAADTAGATDTQSFDITVINTNDPPIFTSTPVTSATQDSFYSYTITTSDVDTEDTVTLSAPGLTTWLDLSSNVLSGTPTNSDVGNHSVVLTATDSGGLTSTQSFTITVANVNDAPTITSSASTFITQDSFYSYTITTNDIDSGDVVTISATKPSWLDLSGNVLSGTPTNSDVGLHSVTITATDTGGLTATQSFTITVENVNDAPTFTSTPILTATEDVGYNYTPTTNDIDMDTVTVSLTTPTPETSWIKFNAGNLGGKPRNSDVGTHNVKLTATDGGLTATQNFTITVANVNDAPTFNNPAITSVNEDSVYSYTGSASDVDTGDSVTLIGTSIPTWLSFNVTTGVLTGTPTNDEVGNHTVKLTANDLNGASVEQNFTITVANVNDPPVFTSNAITTGTEDSIYSYTVTTSDDDTGDTVTLSGPTVPDWLLLNTSSGVLSGTPLNSNVGTNNVIIRATDSTGASATQSFTITVTNTNDAPVINSSAITSVNEDSVYSYTVTTNDVDIGDTVTLTGTTIPSWLEFHTSTGILSGTPTNSEVGNHSVIITATDSVGATDTQNFTITVNNVNDAPTFTSTAITSATEDQKYNYTVTTNDVDIGDSITLIGASIPSWLSFNVTTGLLTGTPTNNEVGNHTVKITAKDSNDASVEQNFTITVSNVNDPPVITSTPSTSVNEDVSYSYAITTNDVDTGDTVTVTVTTKPSWLEFISGTALFGTPTNSDVGNHNVVVKATDSNAGVATQSFTINVINVNDVPDFTSTAIITATQGTLYTYTVTTNDDDVGDVVTLSSSTIPSWLSFDVDTGILTGTPGNSDVGNHTITINAQDLNGGTNHHVFTITVANINDPPDFTSTPITTTIERKVYSYTVTTNDIDTGDSVTLTGTTIPSWATFNTSTGVLTGTPTDSGIHSVVITATDTNSGVTRQEFTITVEEMSTHYIPQLCTITQDRVNDKLKITIPSSQVNNFLNNGLGNYDIKNNNTAISFKFYVLTKNNPQLTALDSNNAIKDLSNIDLSNNITGTNGTNVNTNSSDGVTVNYDIITLSPNNLSGSKPNPTYPSRNSNGDIEVSFPENQTLDQKYGEGSSKFKTIYALWNYDISSSITTDFANTIKANSDYGLVPRNLTFHDTNFLFNNYNFYPSLKGSITNSTYQQANFASKKMDIAYYLPGMIDIKYNTMTKKIDLTIPKNQLDDLSRNSMLDQGFYNITSTNNGAIGCKIYLWYQAGKNYTINPNKLKFVDLSSNTNADFPYDVVINLKPKNTGAYPASFPNGYPGNALSTSWPENQTLERYFNGPRAKWGGHTRPFYALWVWDISSQYLGGRASMSSQTPPNPTFHVDNFLPGGTINQSTKFYGNANIAKLVIPCPPPDLYCDNPRGRRGGRKTLLITKTKNVSNFKMRYASAIKNKRAANSFMC